MRSFIVTAAAGGIGSEVTRRLLSAGGNVFAADVSSRRLAALEADMSALSGRLKTIKADVTDENSAREIVAQASAEFGTLQGLANIAGGIVGIGEDLIDRDLEAITLEEFDRTYALNVRSAFVMTKAVRPHFRASGYGKVVNVASLAAFGNHEGMGNTAYDAAKAAVIGMTRSLSRSLGPEGIRFNVVAPGMVYTERVAAVFGEPFVARHRERTPLGVLTTAGQVADLITFYLNPESDQVTGEVTRVSGGRA